MIFLKTLRFPLFGTLEITGTLMKPMLILMESMLPSNRNQSIDLVVKYWLLYQKFMIHIGQT